LKSNGVGVPVPDAEAEEVSSMVDVRVDEAEVVGEEVPIKEEMVVVVALPG
jgi:hypothetical protein